MELVDHDLGVRDNHLAGISVGCPHIHRHVLNLVSAFEVVQVVNDRVFVAVRQQLDNRIVLDVGNHTTRLDKVDFVNPHPLRRLEPDGLLQLVHVIAKHRPDGIFSATHFFGDAGKGALDRLPAHPVGQAGSHEAFVVHVRQRLVKRLGAGPALKASGVDVQPDPATMHRQIAHHLLTASEPYQVVGLAKLALEGRLFGFCADVVVVVVFFQRNDGVGGQIQNVRGHGFALGLREGDDFTGRHDGQYKSGFDGHTGSRAVFGVVVMDNAHYFQSP